MNESSNNKVFGGVMGDDENMDAAFPDQGPAKGVGGGANTNPAFPHSESMQNNEMEAAQQRAAEMLKAEMAPQETTPQMDIMKEIYDGDWSLAVTVSEFTVGSEFVDNDLVPKASAKVVLNLMVEYNVPTTEGGSTPGLQVIPVSKEFEVNIPYVCLAKFKRPDKVTAHDVEQILTQLFSKAKLIPDPPQTIEKLFAPAAPFSGKHRRDE